MGEKFGQPRELVCAVDQQPFRIGSRIYILHLYIWSWLLCEKHREKAKEMIDAFIEEKVVL